MGRGIDFRQKEVVNITNGKILGFVIDVDAELTNGAIKSIVVMSKWCQNQNNNWKKGKTMV